MNRFLLNSRASRGIAAFFAFSTLVLVLSPVAANVVWGGTTADVVPPLKAYETPAAAVLGELNTSSYTLTSTSNPVTYGGLNSLKAVTIAGVPHLLIDNSNGVYVVPQTDADLNAEAVDPNTTIVVASTFRYGQTSEGATYVQVGLSKREADGTLSARNVVWGGTTGDDWIKTGRLTGMFAQEAEAAPL